MLRVEATRKARLRSRGKEWVSRMDQAKRDPAVMGPKARTKATIEIPSPLAAPYKSYDTPYLGHNRVDDDIDRGDAGAQ